MIFKWPSRHKGAASPVALLDKSQSSKRPDQALKSSDPLAPLAVEDVRRMVDRDGLGFKTTAELTPARGLIGQDRALEALELGARLQAPDFHILVAGPPAAGKTSTVLATLGAEAASRPPAGDWVYVSNFADEQRPRALCLPAGRGPRLARAMMEAMQELILTLPDAFASEEYQSRRRIIEEEVRGAEDEAVDALARRAAQQNVAILRTPLGFAVAPMHEGKVVKLDVFKQLPSSMRREVEARVLAIEKELEAALARTPLVSKRKRKLIADLDTEIAMRAIEAALDEVSAEFADVADVAAFIAEVEADLMRSAASLVAMVLARGDAGRGDGRHVRPISPLEAPFRRYLVNVVSTHGEERGAPIIEEHHPTLASLAGQVGEAVRGDGAVADFLEIRPGVLHRANGGFLVLDAVKVLAEPRAWEALLRSLKTRSIAIGPASSIAADGTSRRIEPQPITLDLKVVLIGERETFDKLREADQDFGRLFKVQAEFADTMTRTSDSEIAYAGLIAQIAARHGLRAVEAEGVARLIEESARLTDDSEKLSLEIGRIADILVEAHHWAGVAGHETIGESDIARAIEEPMRRAAWAREKTREALDRGIVLVDTDGTKVGQINALSAVEAGDVSFGRPVRVTARVRLGQGRMTDIERETRLGGPLHTKGLMILWGYLAGRYALDYPLAIAASVVFEQSYDHVDGDSASAAELFALLSALADAPLRQDLAVTGSVNQLGEVQAVGGVNQKIEGFFDVCQSRGLTGTQGVIIPRANVQHLMLRDDVVAALREGRFAVYGVTHADEALELLTGIKPGSKTKSGTYAKDTLNARIEARLRGFAEKARTFGMGKASAGA